MRPNLLRRLRGNVRCGPRPAALHDDAVKVEIRTLALDPPVMPGLDLGVDVVEVRWA